jgi:hypothetical protein
MKCATLYDGLRRWFERAHIGGIEYEESSTQSRNPTSRWGFPTLLRIGSRCCATSLTTWLLVAVS